MPPVGLPVTEIVCTALQQALAIFCTETPIPVIVAEDGSP